MRVLTVDSPLEHAKVAEREDDKMKSIRNRWSGVAMVLAVGALTACGAQDEAGSHVEARQSELMGYGGTGPAVFGCPSPAPTYPMNRTPDNGNEGCSCVTSSQAPAYLVSMCQTSPRTCGNLYCIVPNNCPSPAPTYSSDKVLRTSATEGCPCVNIHSLPGHLVSMCSAAPSTCDYLYCTTGG